MKLLQCGLLMRNASLVSIRLAGLPCAMWIMSSDNESCEKSQHDLSGSPSPPPPRCVGLCREAGLLRAVPCHCFTFPDLGRGHGELAAILVSSLELVADTGPAPGPAGRSADAECRAEGCSALPASPPTARDGSAPEPSDEGTRQLSGRCLNIVVAAPSPASCRGRHPWGHSGHLESPG